jgi:hypothetical protein
VQAFGWSLAEIDATDVESLLPFVRRFSQTGGKAPAAPTRRVFCDAPEASWLLAE